MKKLALSLFIFCAALARAQVSLVADIYPGSCNCYPGANSSYPLSLLDFNGKLCFSATDGIHGRELWAFTKDSGAAIVADIYPGTNNAISGNTGSMVVCDNVLYFSANDSVHGTELYSWDGINAPVLAADIVIGPASSSPNGLYAFQHKVYFDAHVAGSTDDELWCYDPITGAVTMVSYLQPGYVSGLAAFQGRLYFSADSGTSGQEPFVYDPVSNAVSLVADMYPGGYSSYPSNFVVADSCLYFAAITGYYGFELYKYTGYGSPVRVTDLYHTSGDGVDHYDPMASFNHKVFFSGYDGTTWGVYSFDPATAATQLIAPGIAHGFAVNGVLAFVNDSGLWFYDSAAVLQRAACSEPQAPFNCNQLAFCDSVYYFNGTTSLAGAELFGGLYKPIVNPVVPDKHFAVYPNPALNEINIRFGTDASGPIGLRVVDVYGRSVYTVELHANAVSNEYTLPLQHLARGMYLLQLEGGSFHKAVPFVKE